MWRCGGNKHQSWVYWYGTVRRLGVQSRSGGDAKCVCKRLRTTRDDRPTTKQTTNATQSVNAHDVFDTVMVGVAIVCGDVVVTNTSRGCTGTVRYGVWVSKVVPEATPSVCAKGSARPVTIVPLPNRPPTQPKVSINADDVFDTVMVGVAIVCGDVVVTNTSRGCTGTVRYGVWVSKVVPEATQSVCAKGSARPVTIVPLPNRPPTQPKVSINADDVFDTVMVGVAIVCGD